MKTLWIAGVCMLALAAGAPGEAPADKGWKPLLDGKTLEGWESVQFGGEGEVTVRDGEVHLAMGEPFTGIVWTNKPPAVPYEIELEAKRTMGFDFFCGLTFPAGGDYCTLVIGGWSGEICGLSSLDDLDASQNETSFLRSFKMDTWYRIRLRVEKDAIRAWIDGEKVIDVDIRNRKVSLRPGGMENCKPLGIASWMTGSAVRNARWRPAPSAADDKKTGTP